MDCFSVLIIIFIVAVVIRNAKANARPENRPGQPGSTPVQPQQSRPKTQSIFTQTTQMPNRPIPNQQARGERAVPNRPKAPVQTTINEQLKRMAAETQQRTVTRPAEDVAAEYRKRQEENRRKEELRKKLANAPQRDKDDTKAESGDILDRANANVAEDFISDEAEHAKAAAPMSAQQLFESKETVDLSMAVLEAPGKSELMKEIDDLIVKGYDGSLHFDHDFVSEGIEKLNEMDGMTRIQEA